MAEAQAVEVVQRGLVAALAQFQRAIDVLPRERDVEVTTDKGGTYRFKYATLAALWRMARAPLAEAGLCVIQLPTVSWEYIPPSGQDKFERSRGVVKVVTILRHVSGESVENELLMPVSKVTPQAIGSAISYARRYALGAILGMSSEEEDDDGAEAAGNTIRQPAEQPRLPAAHRAPPTTPPRRPVAGPPATPVSRAEFVQQLDSCRTMAELSRVAGRVAEAKNGGQLTESDSEALRASYNKCASALRAVS